MTVKYRLPTKPRERFMVTAKDIHYLLRGLFGDDWHDYKHERARVQIGSALALFAGSGARAGAVVESSAYLHSNECLYYRVSFIPKLPLFPPRWPTTLIGDRQHLTFNMKWSTRRQLKRWVTIDPAILLAKPPGR